MNRKFYEAMSIVNSMACDIKCKMNALSYKEDMTDSDHSHLAEMAASYDTLCELIKRLDELNEK